MALRRDFVWRLSLILICLKYAMSQTKTSLTKEKFRPEFPNCDPTVPKPELRPQDRIDSTYLLDVSSDTYAVDGGEITVTLQGLQTFSAFIIQPRDKDTGFPGGTWTNIPEGARVVDCSPNMFPEGPDTILNSDNRPRTSLTLTWKAPDLAKFPDRYAPPIIFIAAVYHNRTTYWVDLESIMLYPDNAIYEDDYNNGNAVNNEIGSRGSSPKGTDYNYYDNSAEDTTVRSTAPNSLNVIKTPRNRTSLTPNPIAVMENRLILDSFSNNINHLPQIPVQTTTDSFNMISPNHIMPQSISPFPVLIPSMIPNSRNNPNILNNRNRLNFPINHMHPHMLTSSPKPNDFIDMPTQIPWNPIESSNFVTQIIPDDSTDFNLPFNPQTLNSNTNTNIPIHANQNSNAITDLNHPEQDFTKIIPNNPELSSPNSVNPLHHWNNRPNFNRQKTSSTHITLSTSDDTFHESSTDINSNSLSLTSISSLMGSPIQIPNITEEFPIASLESSTIPSKKPANVHDKFKGITNKVITASTTSQKPKTKINEHLIRENDHNNTITMKANNQTANETIYDYYYYYYYEYPDNTTDNSSTTINNASLNHQFPHVVDYSNIVSIENISNISHKKSLDIQNITKDDDLITIENENDKKQSLSTSRRFNNIDQKLMEYYYYDDKTNDTDTNPKNLDTNIQIHDGTFNFTLLNTRNNNPKFISTPESNIRTSFETLETNNISQKSILPVHKDNSSTAVILQRLSISSPNNLENNTEELNSEPWKSKSTAESRENVDNNKLIDYENNPGVTISNIPFLSTSLINLPLIGNISQNYDDFILPMENEAQYLNETQRKENSLDNVFNISKENSVALPNEGRENLNSANSTNIFSNRNVSDLDLFSNFHRIGQSELLALLLNESKFSNSDFPIILPQNSNNDINALQPLNIKQIDNNQNGSNHNNEIFFSPLNSLQIDNKNDSNLNSEDIVTPPTLFTATNVLKVNSNLKRNPISIRKKVLITSEDY